MRLRQLFEMHESNNMPAETGILIKNISALPLKTNTHDIDFDELYYEGGNRTHELVVLMEDVDDLFLVLMGSIIIFMQAGFGFLEAGSIRAKNTTNILIKNFADLTFGETNVPCFSVHPKQFYLFNSGGLSFWLLGYALAFGDGTVVGTEYFAAIGLPKRKYAHMFFQVSRKKIGKRQSFI